MALSDKFMKLTTENRKKLKEGIPTLIPFSKLPNLAKHVPGIERGAQVIVTANTGIGKSRITRRMFVKEPIEFAKKNNMKLKIFLNSLEESEEKVVSTLMASYLYDTHNIKTDYYSMANYKASNPLTEAAMEKLKEAAQYVDTNYDHSLTVVSQANPKKFYKIVQKYLATVGKFYFIDPNTKTKKQVTNLDMPYNHYEYDEPTIVITIVDTVDKLQGYGDLSQYQAIQKYSAHYSRNLLGKVCNVINVLVSQQNPDYKIGPVKTS